MPVNCDLYINDCVVDPLDWQNPFNFTNPNIHVIRSLGVHPKTSAPKAFFNRLSDHLTTIMDNSYIAGYGPFSIQNNEFSTSPDFWHFISNFSKKLNYPPILISSSSRDIAFIDKIPSSENAIIWQNLNNVGPDHFVNFCRKVLPRSNNNFLTINGKCLEYRFANKVLSQLKDKEIMDKILLGTDSPHYSANYFGPTYSQPLHIAYMMMEIHQHIIKIEDYSHFSLADTNDYFTSKSFSIFPLDLFNKSNTFAKQLAIQKTVGPLLDEYKPLIKFIPQKSEHAQELPKTLPIKRPATTDIALSPIKPENKVLSVLDPCLPDLSWSQPTDTQKHKKACLEISCTPQLQDQKLKISTKENILICNNNSQEPEQELKAPKVLDKENTPICRKSLISKRAFELCHPGYNEQTHSSWSASPSGSKIQVLAIPNKLIKHITEKTKNIPDSELPSILTKLHTSKSK